MAQAINKKVIVVHWKRFGGTVVDVFSNLKGFCDSYSAYNYRTLNNHLSKNKIPFENDEIRIERQPLIQKIETPNLPKVLFWEFDFDKLDWVRSYKTIIERVLDKGSQAEWEEMIKFYAKEYIIHALENEITFLSDTTMEAVCEYFHLEKEKLKCYAKKERNRGYWI